MIKKIFYKLLELKSLNTRLESIQAAVGRLELDNIKSGTRSNVSHGVGLRIFSQGEEDGIIQWLIENIQISRNIFIEFGVGKYTESNTRFLLENNNWTGLVIDGNAKDIDYIKNDAVYWEYNLKADCRFISKDNINDCFRDNGITGNIGLLSIDIDGNDYWVWKEINVVSPDIVICEYNPRYGASRAITIPYNPQFNRLKAHYSGIYFGASIKALTKLAEEKGYSLVAGTSSVSANLFFVRNKLLNDVVKKKRIEEIYARNQFQDSRNKKGSLYKLSYEEEQEILSKFPFVDVEKSES